MAVYGLENGVAVTCNVRAFNAAGEGEVSAASALVTPGENVAERMASAVANTTVVDTTPEDLDADVEQVLTQRTEVVTVIIGRGVDPAVADQVRLSVASVAPSADVSVFEGNQLTPAIAVGVENARP